MASSKMRRVSFTFGWQINIVKIQVESSLTTLFNEQLQSISQLIGTKKIETITVISENAEEGYAVSTVSSEINVLLLVKV
jgi:exopolysaccharide biosynthesis protein